MTQKLREQTIGELKDSTIDILVATDVAARGIDVSRITHVINYDIPIDPEAYVHRIGRTGRAGRSGKAILFVAPRERRLLRSIENLTKTRIPAMDIPTRDQVSEKRINDFKGQIGEALEHPKLSFFTDMVSNYLEESGVELLDLAGALACLGQKDKLLLTDERPERQAKAFTERTDWHDKGQGREQSREKRVHDDSGMGFYRLEVGYQHNVRPGDIVGALVNEADIDKASIGRIQLFDDFSVVQMPVGMPDNLLSHLKRIRIRGQGIEIRAIDAGEVPEQKRPPRGAPRDGDNFRKDRPDRAKAGFKKKRSNDAGGDGYRHSGPVGPISAVGRQHRRGHRKNVPLGIRLFNEVKLVVVS